MKRSNAPAPKQSALARKRALIRSLIEQHGWASPPPSRKDRAGEQSAREIRSNVIPFPNVIRQQG
jgi:hypothetical protein